MQINPDRVKQLCLKRRVRLNTLLADAKVSRTAYYSLTHKASVLPKSISRIAAALGVNPLRFLDDPAAPARRIRTLQRRTDAICRQNPDCDRDVVMRTLMNLDLPPIERLRKALLRGRKPALHR